MGCRYCRPRSFRRIGKNLVKAHGTVINLKRLEEEIKRISLLAGKIFDIPIMKISGYGEPLLLPRIRKTLNALSRNYERVQIITNAALLNEDLVSELSRVPGINVCVSLDGHTPELNFCRTGKTGIIRKILDNITLLRRYKIPVEINSVLTKHNISGFVKFVEYLSDRYDSLTCYPFPVRGFDSLAALGPRNAEKLSPLLDSYRCFSNILPHKEYIRRLISFIHKRVRQDRCYVGYANLGIEPDGSIILCACNLKQSIGNVFKEELIAALDRRKTHPIFYKFAVKELSFEGCSGCFTHYEIINLCLDGTIGPGEIKHIPLFGGDRTQKAFTEIRNELRASFTVKR